MCPDSQLLADGKKTKKNLKKERKKERKKEPDPIKIFLAGRWRVYSQTFRLDVDAHEAKGEAGEYISRRSQDATRGHKLKIVLG